LVDFGELQGEKKLEDGRMKDEKFSKEVIVMLVWK
jgi:hypothetical protein